TGRILLAAAASVVVVFCVKVWLQGQLYASATVMWQATLRGNPECWMCETNLAAEALARGTDEALREAESRLERASQIRPSAPEVYVGLGSLWQKTGRLADSVAAYDRAVALNPVSGTTRGNLRAA